MKFFDLDWAELQRRVRNGQTVQARSRQPAPPDDRPYANALRAMSRHHLLGAHDPRELNSYYQDNFDPLAREELARFMGLSSYYERHRVVETAASVAWLRTALADAAPQLKALLARVIANGGAIALLDLTAAECSALNAAVALLLLFPTLDDQQRPVLCVWPPSYERLTRAPPVMPAAVKPVETWQAAPLADDAAALLVAASASPLRLRGHDGHLFARAERDIAATLTPLPAWVGTITPLREPAARLNAARIYLRALDLVREVGQPGSDYTLQPTKQARTWLAGERKSRLRSLADVLRPRPAPAKPRRQRDVPLFLHEAGHGLPGFFRGVYDDALRASLGAALADAFMSVPAEAFLPVDAFIHYRARVHNPLSDARRGLHHLNVSTEEEQEAQWAALLAEALGTHLLSLGGAALGRLESGEVAFRLTDLGRYILGTADDFDVPLDADARIMVQPNFEIVFLAPAPSAEAEIARFAERIGSGVGTLFRITRASVFTAASAGLDAQHVLTTLQEWTAAELPGNVVREVSGWFASTRHVSGALAYLIRCPDEETATRVLTAIGSQARRVSPDVIELAPTVNLQDISRKLAKLAISSLLQPARVR